MISRFISAEQRSWWLPIILAGTVAWLSFIVVGNTPLIRASGLALVIVGVSAALRRWGSLLAAAGCLALAFSPVFWSQTGGADSFDLLAVLAALAAAALVAGIIAWVSKQPTLGLGVAVTLFAALFLMLISEPGSLRLTTLTSAWLLFLLIDALLRTNPRPDEAQPALLKQYHIFGILLLLLIGVLNDPLLVLLTPAIICTLLVSKTALPRWYWFVLAAVTGYGIFQLYTTYINSTWWTFSAAEAEALGYRMPYMIGNAWRVSARWIELLSLIIEQFTLVGLVIAIFGLSRLTRWYPLLGMMTLIAYSSYFVFGLLYFGRDGAVLLLPLLMVQVIWLSYGVYSIGKWIERLFFEQQPASRWVAPAVFTLLPLLLLLRATGVM